VNECQENQSNALSDGPVKWIYLNPRKRIKRMSNQLVKEVQKSGMTISKEKLIEMIRKSSQTTFSILQSPNSKEKTVVI